MNSTKLSLVTMGVDRYCFFSKAINKIVKDDENHIGFLYELDKPVLIHLTTAGVEFKVLDYYTLSRIIRTAEVPEVLVPEIFERIMSMSASCRMTLKDMYDYMAGKPSMVCSGFVLRALGYHVDKNYSPKEAIDFFLEKCYNINKSQTG